MRTLRCDRRPGIGRAGRDCECDNASAVWAVVADRPTFPFLHSWTMRWTSKEEAPLTVCCDRHGIAHSEWDQRCLGQRSREPKTPADWLGTQDQNPRKRPQRPVQILYRLRGPPCAERVPLTHRHHRTYRMSTSSCALCPACARRLPIDYSDTEDCTATAHRLTGADVTPSILIVLPLLPFSERSNVREKTMESMGHPSARPSLLLSSMSSRTDLPPADLRLTTH